MSNKLTAVVTGTSTGFGNLTAIGLVAAGYQVYGTMRDINGRNAVPRRELEAKGVKVVELDVTDQASIDKAAAQILAEAGNIDLLVNNAGTAHMGIAEAHTPESVERQFATNFFGPVRINRAFLPSMRAQRSGLVVFVSSVVGRFVIPFTGIYTASKFALEALAESMSYELRPSNVDVAIVEPGAYSTNIINVMVGPDDQARLADYGDTAQMFDKLADQLGKDTGNPREVADAIVALARMESGTRPLRTSVPAESPAAAVNAAVAPIQTQVIEAMGFAELQALSVAGVH